MAQQPAAFIPAWFVQMTEDPDEATLEAVQHEVQLKITWLGDQPMEVKVSVFTLRPKAGCLGEKDIPLIRLKHPWEHDTVVVGKGSGKKGAGKNDEQEMR